jgi:hypothetical protein
VTIKKTSLSGEFRFKGEESTTYITFVIREPGSLVSFLFTVLYGTPCRYGRYAPSDVSAYEIVKNADLNGCTK